MADRKPGRVYGLPGEEGVRDGRGCRIFTLTGAKIPMVTRVELDADADEGFATVTATARDAAGQPLLDYERNTPCVVTFRTWVRVAPKGQADPSPTPDAVLWSGRDGVKWLPTDPLPDAAIAELTRAGA